jgi:site-specific recombinase XerD
VLEYVEHLRRDRKNGHSAVNRQVVVVKNFYSAMVALEQMEATANPMTGFPRMKKALEKLPVVLSEEEVERLLDAPRRDTILGLRDRALLTLLYGTGIRASECAGLTEGGVDLEGKTIAVLGKGGRQRLVPLNEQVVRALGQYRQARGKRSKEEAFFQSRRGQGMSRGAIYERVRKWSAEARIDKAVSPHKLRHTFATHLLRKGVKLVVLRELLGHRSLSSTQVYLHVSGLEMREAMEKHPIGRLTGLVEDLLPEKKLPLQQVEPPKRAQE